MPDGAHSRQVDPEVKYSGWHPPTAELAHQKSKEHGESQEVMDKLLEQLGATRRKENAGIMQARKAPIVSLSCLAH